MEFIHGAKITDVPKLDQMGIDKREVAQLLHELFCEQIFVHGFIHRSVTNINDIFIYIYKLTNINDDITYTYIC